MSLRDNLWKYALCARLGLGAIYEYPNLNLAYHTMGRDVGGLMNLLRFVAELLPNLRKGMTVPKKLTETVAKHPEKVLETLNG
jgi:hypothetical protein